MSSATPVGEATGLGRCEIAAVASALVLAAALVVVPTAHSTAAFLLAPAVLLILAWIAASDLKSWIVPDGAVAAVALLGVAARLAPPFAADSGLPVMLGIAADGIAWGGAFLLLREAHFRRRGFDGLGFGDVKLAFACAVLLGTTAFAWALLLASLGGLLAVLLARAAGRRIKKLPFGALLAPACGLIWLVGPWG